MEKTAIEWLDNQIDNELKVIDNLYGKEINMRGTNVSFSFEISEITNATIYNKLLNYNP